MIVLHAFSEGKCEVCGEHIDTPHIPCEKCSEESHKCTVCGKPVEKYSDEYLDYMKIKGFELSEEEFWNKMSSDREFYNKCDPKKRLENLTHRWFRLSDHNQSFLIQKEVAEYIEELWTEIGDLKELI